MMRLEKGSFRDRDNQVFYHENGVYRAISEKASAHWNALSSEKFFQNYLKSGQVVATSVAEKKEYPNDLSKGWARVLRHERIPFISYPYEWTFGMLKTAALLHLDMLEEGIPAGWILKDATSYNVQWRGCDPTFIDTTSFEPHEEGAPWVAYRQFCMMFLYPLMLKAHKGINYLPLLRSNLEGIEPIEMAKYFSRSDFMKKGVLLHVFTYAKVQKRAMLADNQSANAAQSGASKPRHHSEAMLLGTIQSIRRIVQSLKINGDETVWSGYEDSHSYEQDTFADKKKFVEKHVSTKHWPLVWDIGCNTGTFSQICSPYADYVVAMDGDAAVIEAIYQRRNNNEHKNILPLVMNLVNVSPAQGWAGQERKSIEQRGTPDLVLCLALIHHIVISTNIPMRSFIEWLRSLDTCVILEFVGPDDEMTQQLLKNRVNQYEDYTEENFLSIVKEMFVVKDSQSLKNNLRTIHYLEPTKQVSSK